MSILTETQMDRDKELAYLLNLPLKEVQDLPIATPDSIRISDGTKPDNLEDLYRDYKYLNFPAYLKTLMYTSVTRRHSELFKLLKETRNKRCLDFGSGVGSHSIALLENNNKVTMLDVPGKLANFALKRCANRLHFVHVQANYIKLDPDTYDIVICSDTMEHVNDPIYELNRIRMSLKKNGILHLQVSVMIKPSSGHFASSINKWKFDGQKYLEQYFIKEGQTIWRKK